jgi:hypothetical protein
VLVAAVAGGWLAFANESDSPSPAAPSPPAPPPQATVNDAFRGEPEQPEPTVIWAVGDGAIDRPEAFEVGQLIADDDPDRVLYLGDVYDAGTAADFQAGMARVYRPVLDRVLPTPGNHEWPNHVVGYDPFWKKITGARTPPWYAVSLGGWQLLSLNSEATHEPGSPQVRWLRRHLRGTSTCRIAFWHRPRFSAGIHGDQPDIAPLWNAVTGKAVLVLNGHDHDTQRMRPVGGTTEIIAGAGGNGRYPVDPAYERLAFSNDTADAALRIELDGTRARLKVISSGGRTLNRSQVTCRQ